MALFVRWHVAITVGVSCGTCGGVPVASGVGTGGRAGAEVASGRHCAAYAQCAVSATQARETADSRLPVCCPARASGTHTPRTARVSRARTREPSNASTFGFSTLLRSGLGLYPPPRARHTDLPPLCETTVALPPSVLRPEVPDRTCDSMDRTHIRDIKYAPVRNYKASHHPASCIPRSRTGAERCRWGNLYPFYRLSYNAFSFVVTD